MENYKKILHVIIKKNVSQIFLLLKINVHKDPRNNKSIDCSL